MNSQDPSFNISACFLNKQSLQLNGLSSHGVFHDAQPKNDDTYEEIQRSCYFAYPDNLNKLLQAPKSGGNQANNIEMICEPNYAYKSES